MSFRDSYASAITGHPIKVIISMIIITLIIGSGLGDLTVRTNQDGDLPKSDPMVQTKDRIDGVFGDKTEIMIGIQSDTIFRPSTLQKVADISNDLRHVSYVVPDQIRSLSTVNNVVPNEWGLQVGEFMKSVPKTAEEAETLNQAVRDNKLVQGRLVSESGDFTVISAKVEEGYDQATLYNAIYEIVEQYEGPERFYVTGEPIFTQEIDGGIQKDTAVLIPLALLLIMAGLLICFRSVTGVLLPMLAVVLSIVWAMGMMGHLSLPQTAVSSALPLLLVTIASSYTIHLLIYHNNERSGDDRTRSALSRIMPSLIMVGVTSALGAFSLYVFEILMIREFAIAATIGVFSALIINLTIIPAILQIISRRKKSSQDSGPAKPTWLDRRLIAVSMYSFKNSKKVVLVYLGILVIAFIGVSKVKTGLDFLNLFEADNQAKVAFNVFNEKIGGARFINVMVEGDEQGAVQRAETLRQMREFQNYMERQPGVGYTNSIADVLEQIAESVEGERGAEVVIDNDKQVAEYLMLYEMSGSPGDFSDLVDYDYRRAKIQLMLTTSSPDDHKHLYDLAKQYTDEHLGPSLRADFGGDVILWLAQDGYVVKGKILNILMAIAIIVVIVAFSFKSIAAGLLAIVPVAFGVTVTFAIMGFFGLRLDMPTSIITGLAVGIGIDFSIHYLTRLKKEMSATNDYERSLAATSTTSSKAVLFDTFTNMLGFSMLTLSQFLPVQIFGYLVSLTMLLMGASAIILYPALINIVRPKFIFTHQETIQRSAYEPA